MAEAETYKPYRGREAPRRTHVSGLPAQPGGRALVVPPPAGPGGERQPPRLSGHSSYSFFVGFMKVLLPALAAALMLLVVIWPQIAPNRDVFKIPVLDISLEQADSLNMLNARYDGVDRSDRPFTVTADLATQESGSAAVIDLELPKADITLDDGTWLAITARRGYYRRDAETIELAGDVILFHDRGFEVRTESALVDLRGGSAEGDEPVRGQGPAGTLVSDGFRLSERGERIHFTGKSRMVIYLGTEESLE